MAMTIFTAMARPFRTAHRDMNELLIRAGLGLLALLAWNPMLDLMLDPTYEWYAFAGFVGVLMPAIAVGSIAAGDVLARALSH